MKKTECIVVGGDLTRRTIEVQMRDKDETPTGVIIGEIVEVGTRGTKCVWERDVDWTARTSCGVEVIRLTTRGFKYCPYCGNIVEWMP